MTDSRTKDLVLEYRLLPASDVLKAYNIEIAEYPESEAASLENLVYRQTAAPQLFLGCYTPCSRTTKAEAARETEEQRQGQGQGQEHDYGSDVLVGYIVSTLSSDKALTHASMSSHDPKGSSVCIHSVCVAGAYQRKGIARTMMKEYLKHLKNINASVTFSSVSSEETVTSGRLERVLLIAHKELIGLYAGAGFELVGQSGVEHGPDPWYEMVYRL
ncbi:hypothetical protein BC939DRAFT_457682 [Gamsiella multidivaricata]|uniref:uncharacterized protein n=1 Tax=Gamsiella multidivaricata TaxID=101098 RepID=UPI00221F2187|nr:uncharacterized protein BC939DRAFT_457682 [Gamsiella multidivaricata]KAG0364634.1 hypothetical protein BGZ54_007324 [Gamsiella multidivaricata]KAI7820557.1 hypothetical protein BC939DRAFT_457682 [Gamsiella multidivaricata]